MAVERLLEVYSIERYGLLSLLKVKVSGLSAYLALSTRCTPSIKFPAASPNGVRNGFKVVFKGQRRSEGYVYIVLNRCAVLQRALCEFLGEFWIVRS